MRGSSPIPCRTHALRGAVKVFGRFFRPPSQDVGSGMIPGGCVPGERRTHQTRCAPANTARGDDPRARQRAHGRLVGFALGALRLGRAPRPAGLPDRCGRPRDARVPEARWTREAPVPPGLRATACGHRRHARLLLPCGGAGRAFPLCAAGDAPPGGADGTCPWEGWAQGALGRALRAGMIPGRARLPGDAKRVDQGVDQPGMGGEHTRSGRQGGSGRARVDARCHTVR